MAFPEAEEELILRIINALVKTVQCNLGPRIERERSRIPAGWAVKRRRNRRNDKIARKGRVSGAGILVRAKATLQQRLCGQGRTA